MRATRINFPLGTTLPITAKLKIHNLPISICLRSFQGQALIKVDNQCRSSAVIIINPVPFDGCPWWGKTVLRARRPVITLGTCLKYDHVSTRNFRYTRHPPRDSQVPLRARYMQLLLCRSCYETTWTFLGYDSACAICANHFLSVITHAMKARAISER